MHKKIRRRALKFNVSFSNPNKSKMYHLLMRVIVALEINTEVYSVVV